MAEYRLDAGDPVVHVAIREQAIKVPLWETAKALDALVGEYTTETIGDDGEAVTEWREVAEGEPTFLDGVLDILVKHGADRQRTTYGDATQFFREFGKLRKEVQKNDSESA